MALASRTSDAFRSRVGRRPVSSGAAGQVRDPSRCARSPSTRRSRTAFSASIANRLGGTRAARLPERGRELGALDRRAPRGARRSCSSSAVRGGPEGFDSLHHDTYRTPHPAAASHQRAIWSLATVSTRAAQRGFTAKINGRPAAAGRPERTGNRAHSQRGGYRAGTRGGGSRGRRGGGPPGGGGPGGGGNGPHGRRGGSRGGSMRPPPLPPRGAGEPRSVGGRPEGQGPPPPSGYARGQVNVLRGI